MQPAVRISAFNQYLSEHWADEGFICRVADFVGGFILIRFHMLS